MNRKVKSPSAFFKQGFKLLETAHSIVLKNIPLTTYKTFHEWINMTSTNSVYQNVNTDIKTDSFEQGAQKEFLGDQVKKQV